MVVNQVSNLSNNVNSENNCRKMKLFLILGLTLATLNLSDAIFTYIGLKLELVEEANPILASLSPLTILSIKSALTILLVWLLFNPKFIPFKNFFYYFFIGANAIYLFVNAWHLFWIYLVVSSI